MTMAEYTPQIELDRYGDLYVITFRLYNIGEIAPLYGNVSDVVGYGNAVITKEITKKQFVARRNELISDAEPICGKYFYACKAE